MYTLFDSNASYTLPTGENVKGKDLLARDGYGVLFSKSCIVDIIDGIFKSFQLLSEIAIQYGIEYSTDDEQDPQEVLDKVLEKKKMLEENPPLTISDTVKKAAMFSAVTFTDAQALEVRDLYPEFEVNHNYKKDERFTYNGHLFKVNQDHTSQEQWVPGEQGTESLYTNLEMNENGHLNWQQPTGAHDAYNTGDIVNYNGQMYQSQIDGNTTVPGSDERWWKVYSEE